MTRDWPGFAGAAVRLRAEIRVSEWSAQDSAQVGAGVLAEQAGPLVLPQHGSHASIRVFSPSTINTGDSVLRLTRLRVATKRTNE